ncbi:hypothetical protein DJ69_01245 [Halorubrum persicum]|uniref:Uncharacterized protein n=1 Tax=Halorubrum persicum TaxID=1383844 RepID=A0A2G1WN63_9EURY|nr:hypothetical protein [Halorubrum persicum]PHQ40432.1 hypothetical protein DJ69_01245 [Halorubrum persicum]
MTDAALSITQSAVEQFTEQYLTEVGCTVQKDGGRWTVIAPEGAETEVLNGEISLLCGEPSSDLGENERELHPESTFFQELIAEASERSPTGRIILTSEGTQIEMPPWIQQSDVEVATATFTPYYDRTAVVFLYRIGIETVSEYQTELLRAIAVDTRSTDPLPKLEDTFLQSVSSPAPIEASPVDFERSEARNLIEQTREVVVDRVQPKIDEIHQEASRAADAEIEEYRQLQQQRIQELQEKTTQLSSRIDDLSESIQQSNTQSERMQALEKRKEIKAEYEDAKAELEKLRHRRDQGFPEKQQEIRERHALEVVVTPLTVTQVEYERGELELELEKQGVAQSLTIGYGNGVGVTDEMRCDSCNQLLTEDNPVQEIGAGIRCSQC